jgi:DNA (cytosine-5)-methyltransferase 1
MMSSLTFISLFAGIGGIDLGLERAGMTCVAQVEIDDYATRVLEKHWPNVPRFKDVRGVGAHNLPQADVVAGGFPCQPHSAAGKRRGGSDERDLWPEYRRIIREIRPRWVLGENVPGILSTDNGRFFGGFLRDLAALGYDAEWSVLSACALGAPHTRERVFIVAYTHEIARLWWGKRERGRACPDGRYTPVRAPDNLAAYGLGEVSRWWVRQPSVGRVVDGVPRRLDRVGYLGNAVVPQAAELVGRYITMISEAIQ